MAAHATVFTGGIIVLLAFIAVVTILQIFLSKTDSKWAGLIMPVISFGISLLITLRSVLFSLQTRTFSGYINGEYIEYIESMFSIIGTAIMIFVLFNISTGILIAIYTACRGKKNRQRALEMMNIQDLG